MAKAAGVNQQTLRYYERRGLLAPPTRRWAGAGAVARAAAARPSRLVREARAP
ncbi:MerR family DNA-binding transcriptional regulator [Pedococcus sp.]|uniref:MerR family DNA-binding transcriptional regulator n=1 Tax=Pedococcus sp. TaxID=2860345 RepID=UPI0039C91427